MANCLEDEDERISNLAELSFMSCQRKALIWSKMSTGLPIEIKSSMNRMFLTFIHEKQENEDRWHGAEIQIVVERNWTTYRSKVNALYARQMAVITPYAQFLFQFISDSPEKNVLIRFTRRTYIMPSVPLETKYHPSDVDILLIKRLITETSKHSFAVFLQHEFVAVSCRTFNREEIGRSNFNPMIGLGDHERRDEALYIGFETAKAREKRLAKEARVLEIQEKNVALGKNVKDSAATKAAKGREALYYRVTCNVSSVSLCSSIC
ncbi:hypothetical protein KY289_026662 [Solanum tuberosum]|nr:hypothetical protein KY289_026662 [Solanum tuberosum]